MRDRSTVQTVAMLAGAVFLLVGILGFIPGITSNAPGDFAGSDSDAELLGIFKVSILHSLVHALFGIAGLAMARTWQGARTFLIGGGVIYLVLWIYGLLIDKGSDANFVPLNTADNWLHFALGVGMIVLGFLTTRARPVTTAV
jgi:hypothetical protein